MVEETRASGKRRRGAYQRHLLIYFAAVGRSAVHGRRGSSLGFAPTNLSPLPLARSVCTRDDYKRDRGHTLQATFSSVSRATRPINGSPFCRAGMNTFTTRTRGGGGGGGSNGGSRCRGEKKTQVF